MPQRRRVLERRNRGKKAWPLWVLHKLGGSGLDRQAMVGLYRLPEAIQRAGESHTTILGRGVT